MRNGRPAWRERGAAAVEFALVVPLLLTLVFGIISYGYLLSFRQSLSQAAAEGARAAAVAPATSDRQAISFAAVGATLQATCSNDADFLTCSTATPTGCRCLEVSVSWDYAADASKPKFVFGFALPDTLTYTSTVQVNQVDAP